MNTNETIAEFQELHFHDFGLEKLNIIPSNFDTPESNIEVVLSDPDDDSHSTIKFLECANISFNADFDVLKDNAGAGNTSHIQAEGSLPVLEEIIKKQQILMNVEYEGVASPTEKKLKSLKKYVAFTIYFFGGTLVVIAKGFEILKTNG